MSISCTLASRRRVLARLLPNDVSRLLAALTLVSARGALRRLKRLACPSSSARAGFTLLNVRLSRRLRMENIFDFYGTLLASLAVAVSTDSTNTCVHVRAQKSSRRTPLTTLVDMLATFAWPSSDATRGALTRQSPPPPDGPRMGGCRMQRPSARKRAALLKAHTARRLRANVLMRILSAAWPSTE